MYAIESAAGKYLQSPKGGPLLFTTMGEAYDYKLKHSYNGKIVKL